MYISEWDLMYTFSIMETCLKLSDLSDPFDLSLTIYEKNLTTLDEA
jgi:hypothetical protein